MAFAIQFSSDGTDRNFPALLVGRADSYGWTEILAVAERLAPEPRSCPVIRVRARS